MHPHMNSFLHLPLLIPNEFPLNICHWGDFCVDVSKVENCEGQQGKINRNIWAHLLLSCFTLLSSVDTVFFTKWTFVATVRQESLWAPFFNSICCSLCVFVSHWLFFQYFKLFHYSHNLDQWLGLIESQIMLSIFLAIKYILLRYVHWCINHNVIGHLDYSIL